MARRELPAAALATASAAVLVALVYVGSRVITVAFRGTAFALGLGNGAVFKLVAEHVAAEAGTVTGLVGAAGGLGGFFPPLLMGAVHDATGGLRDRVHAPLRGRAGLPDRERAGAPAARRAADAGDRGGRGDGAPTGRGRGRSGGAAPLSAPRSVARTPPPGRRSRAGRRRSLGPTRPAQRAQPAPAGGGGDREDRAEDERRRAIGVAQQREGGDQPGQSGEHRRDPAVEAPDLRFQPLGVASDDLSSVGSTPKKPATSAR
jgi:hypothetical protein